MGLPRGEDSQSKEKGGGTSLGITWTGDREGGLPGVGPLAGACCCGGLGPLKGCSPRQGCWSVTPRKNRTGPGGGGGGGVSRNRYEKKGR